MMNSYTVFAIYTKHDSYTLGFDDKKSFKYVLATLFGIFILFLGVGEYFSNKSLNETGVAVNADVKEFFDAEKNSRNDISAPRVAYCFRVDSKEYCSAGQIIDAATYDSCKKRGSNAKVEILYDPGDPEISALKGSVGKDSSFEWPKIGFSLALLGVAIYSIAKKHK